MTAVVLALFFFAMMAIFFYNSRSSPVKDRASVIRMVLMRIRILQMLRITKAGFFGSLVVRQIKKTLVLLISLLICGTHPAIGQTTEHAKTSAHHPAQSSTKKHTVSKKSHPHKRHSAKKPHPLRHPQLRSGIPDGIITTDEPQTAEISSVKPLNHNLATINLTNVRHSSFPGLVSSVKKDVVNFVKKTVNTLRYSSYKFGGKRFDPERGVYIVDCSNFVDHILQNVYPDAYSNLVNSAGADTPASQHYFNFFHELGEESGGHWNKINYLDQLQPGDILVFRYKNSHGAETGGHVMVVMEKPEHAGDVYFVRIADSAPSRHSEDTRHLNESGIGIGTLLLKANIYGQPSAFAWGVNSYWNKNVKFAMARPVEFKA